jgi:uncharacterized protein (TIGR03790 family)
MSHTAPTHRPSPDLSPRGRGILIAALFVAAIHSPALRAELLPEQVAVVAARGNRESQELAEYYLKARGIPATHLCLVDMPLGETCPRDQWTWAVRPEIRKWLDEHDPQRQLKCLVTVRGVPLKVSAVEIGPDETKYRLFLEGDRAKRLELLAEVGKQLDALAPDVAIPTADPAAAAPATGGSEARNSLERHLRDAQARIAKLSGAELEQAGAQLRQLAVIAGGSRALVMGLERQAAEAENVELRTQYDMLRGRLAGLAEMQAVLEQSPPGYDRDMQVLAALERNGGQLAILEWLDQQLAVLAKNETGASLDSELALVYWPDDYQLLRWQPNYLRAGFEATQWRMVRPTMMVARIDGPTLELARGLIDAAIQTETDGLTGKAYFDARGTAKLEDAAPTPGSYEDYDRALLAVAKGFSEQTTIETTLNNGPELFQAGQCPDAALYCGWYSLAKYVDAFEWRPGAVAYHLASSEADTLQAGDSEVWCKRLIEDGVAATIGPVYEPYLMAFPRPEQFFGLLLKGELTLAECYYRTLPFNSWMMVLVGDPLYRPFKNRTVLRDGAAAAVSVPTP